MSKQDAYADGREQGWRDKERECEKMATDLEIQRGKELMEWQATTIAMRNEITRLRKEVDDLRAEVNYLKHVLGQEE